MAIEPRTSGVFSLGALGGDEAASGDANWSSVVQLFDGAASGSTLTDAAGANNGTLTYNATATGDADDSGAITAQPNGTSLVKFDTTGGYVTATASSDFAFGTGAFTVETWVYITQTPTNGYGDAVFDTRTSANGAGILLVVNPSLKLDFYSGGWRSSVSSSTLALNTWHHIALSRDANNNWTTFVDGTAHSASTFTTTLSNNNCYWGAVFDDGGSGANTNWRFTGYMADMRVTKGVARDIAADWTAGGYSSALPQGAAAAGATRPTRRWGGMTGRSLVESTAASGDANWSDVTLLLRGDNSTLEDKSGSTHTNYLSWSGTPTYGTGKYGGAFYFSDASRYLNGPTTLETNDFQFGTGDFTIETWVYLPSGSNFNTGDKCLFETRGYGTGGWVWFFTGTGNNSIVQNYYISGAPVYATSNHLSPDTWHHVALVRSGSNITFWRDGVASTGGASNVGSTNFSQGTGNGFHIGQRYDAVATTSLTGLVDDFRITTGVARDIAADWAAGLYNSPLPQGPAVAASTNVPTTGVLSLAEDYQTKL